MRIIAKKTLRGFWKRHPDAEQPLLAWYREVRKEDWETPTRVKERYGNASIIGGNRVVFDIKGNSYRLVAEVDYTHRTVRIRFVGTHDQYARIDAKRI